MRYIFVPTQECDQGDVERRLVEAGATVIDRRYAPRVWVVDHAATPYEFALRIWDGSTKEGYEPWGLAILVQVSNPIINGFAASDFWELFKQESGSG